MNFALLNEIYKAADIDKRISPWELQSVEQLTIIADAFNADVGDISGLQTDDGLCMLVLALVDALKQTKEHKKVALMECIAHGCKNMVIGKRGGAKYCSDSCSSTHRSRKKRAKNKANMKSIKSGGHALR